MTKSDVQTSLRLPEELRDRLAQEAANGGRGMGEEIRRRLEASFGAVPAAEDQKTSVLLRVIAQCAAILNEHWAPWHADAGPFAAFQAAIIDVLSRHKPEASGATPSAASQWAMILSDPKSAGAVLAFLAENTAVGASV